jgi:hypothetical protein
MNLLGSLIPGVREVRAPLVSGYLWCVFLWLLLAPHVPSPHGQAVYEHLVELAEAMGPIGKAVTVSIVAYLIGSLAQSVVGLVVSRLSERRGPLDREGEELANVHSLEPLRSLADPDWRGRRSSSLGIGNWRSFLAIQELSERELSESFRGLQLAIEVAESREEGPYASYFMNGTTPMVRLRMQGETGSIAAHEFVIPQFDARELIDQRSLLETRLLEVAPGTGAQVERFQAEAEFRFAIAGPLVFLAVLLSVDVSLLWAAALVVPAAMVMQGRELSRQATRELFDALRARAQTDELESITPIYGRYRTFSSQLVTAIGDAT